MPFLDRIRIRLEAGSGGGGAVSFRREKFAPTGGPDGGDGGDGGDVTLHTTTSVQDFSHLAGVHLFKAASGQNGKGGNRRGRNGPDVTIEMPQGTIVCEADTGAVLADLDALDVSLVAAHGGKGGRGNSSFATATNQAPRTAEKGEKGEQRLLDLELKIIADIGLIGLPNAGKSTLLSRISRAHPKIAPYPFTTVHPNVGVVQADLFGRLVVADIPGLIKGAHTGRGLGFEFLRHIERTRILVHVIDAAAADPVADYRTLREELRAYGRGLEAKKTLVLANKMDVPPAAEGLAALEAALDCDVVAVSALTGDGVALLIDRLQSLPEGADGMQ